MAKPAHATYRLDSKGIFRTSGGSEADYCRVPCSIYTDVGKVDCVTRDDVKAAVLVHCEAVGIFDAAPIVAWALEDESDAINPQAIQGGGPHTGIPDEFLIF